jgi:DNA-binding transcriptional LysR family regulator
MLRDNLNDLVGFIAVAREGSFTKAAAKLGISQSALSHTISGLEKKLGIRLLARSTRSVSTTEAGERLLAKIGPKLDEIGEELSVIGELSGSPSGTIRINASEHPAKMIIWPKLAGILKDYPDLNVELTIDHKLIDIVAERYDLGVRLGESLPKDMIAIRISADTQMAVVGTKQYFDSASIPLTPDDLKRHNCINYRLPTSGGIYSWEFEKDQIDFSVRLRGQITFNSSYLAIEAALAGLGVAYLPHDMAQEYIDQGLLIRVLEDWCPPFSGYHIYYPNRHQPSSAFTTIVEALRYRE